MMREIGSEFWTGCTPTGASTEYSMRPMLYSSFNTIETLSGRTALEYVVERLMDAGKKSVYMPSYCCHTMIEPFVTHGMKVFFYDVMLSEEGLKRDLHLENECDVIFLMDYFGYIDSETNEMAKDQKARGKTLVYDATHSMYSPVDLQQFDYIFGSYRKWVDINCGFIAQKEEFGNEMTQNRYSEDMYPQLRKKLFDLKAEYVNGQITDKQEFLNLINIAEENLEENYHHKMPDERSMNVLKLTNVEYVKKRRQTNGSYLTTLINELNSDKVKCFNRQLSYGHVPLFIPIYVNRDMRTELRRYLITKEIYCPVHWPDSDYHQISERAKDIYAGELSLICDQRYEAKDMERIAEEIKKYLITTL